MAGTLVADVLQDGAGNSTAMDNAIYGSAKAWVSFGDSGGTITARANYNVSSVTRTATGSFTITFSNALSDANYSAVASASANSGGTLPSVDVFGINSGNFYQAPTTSSFTIYTTSLAASAIDPVYVNIAVYR